MPAREEDTALPKSGVHGQLAGWGGKAGVKRSATTELPSLSSQGSTGVTHVACRIHRTVVLFPGAPALPRNDARPHDCPGVLSRLLSPASHLIQSDVHRRSPAHPCGRWTRGEIG